ncbi:MAG: hypothetical protein QOG64_820, partial [Acidimicrobiaceae bacterium]|nr:hypothetical protein [Acidimicrobiaceae bacterium]
MVRGGWSLPWLIVRTAPQDGTRTPDVRRLLLLVGGLVLVDTMFFSAVTPLLPQYAHRLGLSKAGAGLLSATYALGTFAGAIPSGLLAARVGVRKTVYVGLGGMAVTGIVFGL